MELKPDTLDAAAAAGKLLIAPLMELKQRFLPGSIPGWEHF